MPPPIHCLTCGYSLVGLPGDRIRCPECGELTDVSFWPGRYRSRALLRCERLANWAAVLPLFGFVFLIGAFQLLLGYRFGAILAVLGGCVSGVLARRAWSDLPHSSAGLRAFAALAAARCGAVLGSLAVMPGSVVVLAAVFLCVGRHARSNWIDSAAAVGAALLFGIAAFAFTRWANTKALGAARRRMMDAIDAEARPPGR